MGIKWHDVKHFAIETTEELSHSHLSRASEAMHNLEIKDINDQAHLPVRCDCGSVVL